MLISLYHQTITLITKNQTKNPKTDTKQINSAIRSPLQCHQANFVIGFLNYKKTFH